MDEISEVISIIIFAVCTIVIVGRSLLKYAVKKAGVYRTELFVVRLAPEGSTKFKYVCELTKKGRDRFRGMIIYAWGDTIEEAYFNGVDEVRKKLTLWRNKNSKS